MKIIESCTIFLIFSPIFNSNDIGSLQIRRRHDCGQMFIHVAEVVLAELSCSLSLFF